jgi:hypothetical protein
MSKFAMRLLICQSMRRGISRAPALAASAPQADQPRTRWVARSASCRLIRDRAVHGTNHFARLCCRHTRYSLPSRCYRISTGRREHCWFAGPSRSRANLRSALRSAVGGYPVSVKAEPIEET